MFLTVPMCGCSDVSNIVAINLLLIICDPCLYLQWAAIGEWSHWSFVTSVFWFLAKTVDLLIIYLSVSSNFIYAGGWCPTFSFQIFWLRYFQASPCNVMFIRGMGVAKSCQNKCLLHFLILFSRVKQTACAWIHACLSVRRNCYFLKHKFKQFEIAIIFTVTV